jgi:hypothetical protein
VLPVALPKKLGVGWGGKEFIYLKNIFIVSFAVKFRVI